MFIASAIWPMVMYLLLQLPVAVVGSLTIRDRELGWTAILRSWLMGQMIAFAVLQIMAVPMILLRWQFNALFWSYLGVMAIVFGLGLWRLVKHKTRIRIGKPDLSPLALVLFIVVAVLVLWQSGNYFFGIHLDEDDSRFLAQANDALEYGQLLTRNWDTGDYLGYVEPARDITSPWPLMYAILSRVLFTRPVVFAHTIYPPVEVFLMYGIYWLIGSELFKKTEARVTFLLTVTAFILFFGGSTYTQGAFSLVRIWQGKATVAAIIVPLMLYLFIRLNRHNEKAAWFPIIITSIAACLMSGAGVMIALIMAGVYGAYHILAYKTWKQILTWLGSLVPSAVSLLIFLTYKG